MRVSCLQENLARGLAIVGRAVASRSTLPVLSNIYLGTDDGRLKLAATNLEIGITCWIGAQVEEEGRTTVPARVITELVNSSPPERIDLDLNVRTQTMQIQCAHFQAQLKGIDASDFPIIPVAEQDERPTVAAGHAARNGLSGSFCGGDGRNPPHSDRRTDGNQRLHHNDGFGRWIPHICTVSLPGRPGGREHQRDHPHACVAGGGPGHRGSGEAGRNLRYPEPQPGPVPHAECGPGHSTDRGELSRLQADSARRLRHANRFGHRRVSPGDPQGVHFARDAANMVRLQISAESEERPGHMRVIAEAAELGDNVEELGASVEGEDIEIAFNARYLIDVLSVIGTAQTIIETTDATSRGAIRPADGGDFTHVIMPMHITQR